MNTYLSADYLNSNTAFSLVKGFGEGIRNFKKLLPTNQMIAQNSTGASPVLTPSRVTHVPVDKGNTLYDQGITDIKTFFAAVALLIPIINAFVLLLLRHLDMPTVEAHRKTEATAALNANREMMETEANAKKTKKNGAAIKIQCAFRRHVAKNVTKYLKKLKTAQENRTEAETTAAVKIQHAFRGHIARNKAKRKEISKAKQDIVRIKGNLRNRIHERQHARQEARILMAERNAAIGDREKIQAEMRKAEKAATKIQSVFRGHRARIVNVTTSLKQLKDLVKIKNAQRQLDERIDPQFNEMEEILARRIAERENAERAIIEVPTIDEGAFIPYCEELPPIAENDEGEASDKEIAEIDATQEFDELPSEKSLSIELRPASPAGSETPASPEKPAKKAAIARIAKACAHPLAEKAVSGLTGVKLGQAAGCALNAHAAVTALRQRKFKMGAYFAFAAAGNCFNAVVNFVVPGEARAMGKLMDPR